ncbi:L-asparaginase [Leeuwenhoekiella aestuarii]|uniref:asparaginase n=2 Tax=Leeuwenhoekiella aestuarii TaxID=2249426 RepID=A0A4Q0NSN1_9FLAO|nr:type I asparaginase [Leeuwenhoekiella aestuarii]RXG14145.1 L-asparaginase [Leeuwenhoekiella aestuarii]
MSKQPKILLIYTGGTIGMIKDFETGALKAFDFKDLLEKIPELRLLECEIETTSFDNPIDSSNMNPDLWVDLCNIIESNYDRCDGFVILHGSDTMSYTASALSFMLENLSKPVIFTGSQLPIGDLRTDAKENLITAIQIAALRKRNRPYITEVGLYFEYKLYRGNRSSKISAEHFEAFKSPNYPPLATSGVYLTIEDEKLLPYKRKKLIVHRDLKTDIMVVHLYPGISQKMLTSILNNHEFSGVILLTFGSGNSTTSPWFIELLKKNIQKGVPVVNITQCTWGSVQMGNYETSTGLKNLGVISGKDLTIEAAITKMMYLNSQNLSPKVFKTIFETSLRGEMS